MKSNPFYGMSAAAMLFGCYMVSHALRLEPGRSERLLVLIGVLQVYEALLVVLGVFLVATRRAPRDGVSVLLLETLFLMDATLLATECVTAEVGLGIVCMVVLAAFALAKLAAVRLFSPRLLPGGTAWLLGLQAMAVLAIPVIAALLASRRTFDEATLCALWWATLALPLARHRLLGATPARPGTSRGLSFWSWVPAASVLLHLWAAGWIHQVAFRPADLAPFVLGLALTARREEVDRQVLLPAFALLLSVAQGDSLGVAVPALGSLSPLGLTGLAAASTWTVLAWRHRHPWLVALATASILAGLVAPALSRILSTAGQLGRWIVRALPRGALGWGVSGVAAAFVLLGIGTWTSLRGWPPRVSPWRRPRLPGGAVTLALLLSALAGGLLLAAMDLRPLDASHRRTLLAQAGWLALLAASASVWALRRHPCSGRGAPPRPTVTLGLVVTGGGLLFLSTALWAGGHGAARNESRVVGDVRTVIAAQAAYGAANAGYADGDLACLAHPSACLPGYGTDQPAFLDEDLADLGLRHGYVRSFQAGPASPELRLDASPSSVTTWAYLAVPAEPGVSGARSFCGDSAGRVCFTVGEDAPPRRDDGTCDVGRCTVLR